MEKSKIYGIVSAVFYSCAFIITVICTSIICSEIDAFYRFYDVGLLALSVILVFIALFCDKNLWIAPLLIALLFTRSQTISQTIVVSDQVTRCHYAILFSSYFLVSLANIFAIVTIVAHSRERRSQH